MVMDRRTPPLDCYQRERSRPYPAPGDPISSIPTLAQRAARSSTPTCALRQLSAHLTEKSCEGHSRGDPGVLLNRPLHERGHSLASTSRGGLGSRMRLRAHPGKQRDLPGWPFRPENHLTRDIGQGRLQSTAAPSALEGDQGPSSRPNRRWDHLAPGGLLGALPPGDRLYHGPHPEPSSGSRAIRSITSMNPIVDPSSA
jgi:hypothetical protein